MKRQISQTGLLKIRAANYKRWLQEARSKHKNNFDYSLTEENYRTVKKPKIKITCLTHNDIFDVTPEKHILYKSGGCKICEREIRETAKLGNFKQSFLNWFEEHASKRLELRSDFLGMTIDTKFYCKIHRSIKVTKPTLIMNEGAMGCDKCSSDVISKKVRKPLNKYAEEAKALIKNEYVKLLETYFDEKSKSVRFTIECEIHGKQNNISFSYINKTEYSCPLCGKEHQGYTNHRLKKLLDDGEQGKPTYLGVMEIEAFGIHSLKVGVTTRTLEERYAYNLKQIFYYVKISEIDAYVLENRIHRKFKQDHDLRILKKGMRQKERWAGDTECYFFRVKEPIINFINDYLNQVKISKVNYRKELENFQVPNFFPIDTSRPKDLSNLPMPVVGVDPKTNKVVKEFASHSDARRAGYGNVSMVINKNYNRNYSGGLRWFQKEKFDPDNIPEIKMYKKGKPVRCIETGEVFVSTTQAAQKVSQEGYPTNGSHITSVCRGNRKLAGGFTWEYAGITIDEAEKLKGIKLKNYTPQKVPNIPKSVRIIDSKTKKIIGEYVSLTSAAKSIGSGASNISKSIKNNIAHKGYNFELIK